jgi:hypothetical protein
MGRRSPRMYAPKAAWSSSPPAALKAPSQHDETGGSRTEAPRYNRGKQRSQSLDYEATSRSLIRLRRFKDLLVDVLEDWDLDVYDSSTSTPWAKERPRCTSGLLLCPLYLFHCPSSVSSVPLCETSRMGDVCFCSVGSG